MGREWRGFLWRTLAFFAVLEAMLVPAILYWPSFEENISAIRTLVPLPAMRDMLDQLEAGGVVGYVMGQHFFKGCNVTGTAAAVLAAMGAVAGEAQRGTLELWLARPLTRRRVLLERWLFGAMSVAIPVVASTATIPWLLSFVDEQLALRPLFWASIHQVVFLWSIYSLTFFLSTIGRNPIGIAFGVLFFTIFEFAIYLVKTATHWSLFRLADLPTYLAISEKGGLDLGKTLPLLAVSALLVIFSVLAFERRVP